MGLESQMQLETPSMIKKYKVSSTNSQEGRTAVGGVLREMASLVKEPMSVRVQHFKSLQLAWHPDKNDAIQRTATSVFQVVQAAKSWFLA